MATPQDEILYRASVLDETIEFFERFDRHLERIARNTEQGFNRVDTSVKESGRGLGAITGIVAGISTALTNMALQGVAQLKNLVGSSIQLAARVDTLGISVQRVAANFGYSQEQVAEYEASIKDMGITTQGARQIILSMLQANLDLGRSTELARVAQDAAVIAGTNSTDTFVRMLYAVQRLDTEILRNLGIVIDLQAEYKRAAGEIGRTTDSLSTAEKQQIALNAVIAKGGEIAGTYEAAMGTAGKQAGSMARLIEEVQLAIGKAFQPAYAIQIEFINSKLKEMVKWFEENEEVITALSERLGIVVEQLFTVLDKVLEFAASIPSRIESIGLGIANLIAQVTTSGEREINKSNTNVLRTAGQLLSIFAGFIRAIIQSAVEVVQHGAELIRISFNSITGKPREELTADIEAFEASLSGVFDRINDEFDAGFINATHFFGLVGDKSEEAADELEENLGGAEEDLSSFQDALKEVEAALQSLHDKMEEEAELRAIQDAREAMLDALRLTHQLEDIELSHQQRLRSIRENFEEQQEQQQERADDRALQLEEARNEKNIQLERDFQRTLRNLRQSFIDDAGELARQRDAVGLLARMRQYNRDVAAARQAQEDKRGDAEREYQKQLSSLQESLKKETTALEENLKEQLAKAEEARQQDLENLQRSLKRQEEFRALHRQFEEEDRKRAFEKELEQLAEQFVGIDGLTEEGLAKVLEQWEDYFGDLSLLIEEYAAIIAAQMEAMFDFEQQSPRRGGRGRPSGGGRGGGGRGQSGEGGVVGQAGQVSSMLANPQLSNMWRVPVMQSVPQVPAVQRGAQVSRREIFVQVQAHDPYLSQQITNTLYEIERNRG